MNIFTYFIQDFGDCMEIDDCIYQFSNCMLNLDVDKFKKDDIVDLVLIDLVNCEFSIYENEELKVKKYWKIQLEDKNE